MKFDEAKHKFIQSWGVFGTNWGINKTMAQIHALLLISSKPLSTEDVMSELQISRGNANMNIRALMNWGIVYKTFKPGERKEFFVADKDVWEVARKISKERTKKELEPVIELLEELKQVQGNDVETQQFKETVGNLHNFTESMFNIVHKFIKSDKNWFFKKLLKFIK